MREGGSCQWFGVWKRQECYSTLVLDSSNMFQLILVLIVTWICINSLLYWTFILVVFSSPSTKGLSTECKRWKDTVLSSLSKGIYLQAKLHHHYQQIGTSSQQTHISQASMEMWSKVDQENLKTIIQLQC